MNDALGTGAEAELQEKLEAERALVANAKILERSLREERDLAKEKAKELEAEAAKFKRQMDNLYHAYDLLRMEKTAETELWKGRAEAMASEKADSSFNGDQIEWRKKAVKAAEANGWKSPAMLAEENEKIRVALRDHDVLTAYKANAEEIFQSLRVLLEMQPGEGLMDVVEKLKQEVFDLKLRVTLPPANHKVDQYAVPPVLYSGPPAKVVVEPDVSPQRAAGLPRPPPDLEDP